MGKGNTQSILKKQGPVLPYVATVCSNYAGGGFTDWYMPSRYELNLMWLNVGFGASNIGGFNPGFYWSSTEATSGTAWAQLFDAFVFGDQIASNKNIGFAVRAVRAF